MYMYIVNDLSGKVSQPIPNDFFSQPIYAHFCSLYTCMYVLVIFTRDA